jgi:hypothetical protein
MTNGSSVGELTGIGQKDTYSYPTPEGGTVTLNMGKHIRAGSQTDNLNLSPRACSTISVSLTSSLSLLSTTQEIISFSYETRESF